MKLLLVDLDDTLLDTGLLKKAFFEKLAGIYELDYQQILEVYEDHKNKLDTDDWIEDFTVAFDQDIWFRSKDLNRMGLPFTVNKEILDFVTHFSGAKIVFSYGNEKLQQAKIDAINIRDIFNSIIVTPRDKFTVLEAWISGDHSLNIDGTEYNEVVLIDDNQQFIEKVKKNYPWIITALVNQGKIQN